MKNISELWEKIINNKMQSFVILLFIGAGIVGIFCCVDIKRELICSNFYGCKISNIYIPNPNHILLYFAFFATSLTGIAIYKQFNLQTEQDIMKNLQIYIDKVSHLTDINKYVFEGNEVPGIELNLSYIKKADYTIYCRQRYNSKYYTAIAKHKESEEYKFFVDYNMCIKASGLSAGLKTDMCVYTKYIDIVCACINVYLNIKYNFDKINSNLAKMIIKNEMYLSVIIGKMGTLLYQINQNDNNTFDNFLSYFNNECNYKDEQDLCKSAIEKINYIKKYLTKELIFNF